MVLGSKTEMLFLGNKQVIYSTKKTTSQKLLVWIVIDTKSFCVFLDKLTLNLSFLRKKFKKIQLKKRTIS
jgi:hypothetical protein